MVSLDMCLCTSFILFIINKSQTKLERVGEYVYSLCFMVWVNEISSHQHDSHIYPLFGVDACSTIDFKRSISTNIAFD